MNNTLKRTNNKYVRRFPVIISFIRINTLNIRLFQKAVGNTVSKSFPDTSVEIASSCSDFNAWDIVDSERHLSGWQRMIDSWSVVEPIRSSVHGRKEYGKITLTSSRRNLHSTTPTPLLIFDSRPPPWYKFLSLPSLPLPLKSKMATKIFV